MYLKNGMLGCLVITALLFVFACKTGDEEMEEMEIEEEEMIYTFQEGDFVGIWNSNNSTTGASASGLSVSATISEGSEGAYTGLFYFTGNFKSWDGKEGQDGNLSFKISENELTGFVLRTITASGTFRGTGQLVADNRIRITMKGDDDDGSHSGTISFQFSK